MRKWCLSAAVSVLAVAQLGAGAAFAQAEGDITLIEALARALADNPTLAAEEARYQASREAIAQARAGGLPQVSASASYSSRDIDPENPIFDTLATGGGSGSGGSSSFNNTDLDTLQYGVEATQTIFAGLTNWNSIRQAKAQVRAGAAQLYGVEQQVMLEAATAYLDVIRDQSVLELRNNNVRVLTRQLEAARARFDVGEVTRTDVAQAEARLASARAQVFNAQAQLAASEADFESVIGFPPGELIDPPAAPATPPSLDEAHAFALDNAPAVIAAQEAERASQHGVSAAYGRLSPQVDAYASYSYGENQQFEDDSTEETAIGVRASIPLFAGGANYSRIRQARRTNTSDRFRVTEAMRTSRQQVIASWTALEASRATIEAASSAVSANEIAFEGVRQEAQVGARTTLDVLDAEQELLNARVQLVTAKRDEEVASYTLLAAIGALTPERFGIQ